ncbi:MAG: tRNA (N(6)-L-threonylcarbamoyladenosine(37)-C(2))-methylthiotransferase MtaB [bacterium]|nr:tRNA (N(6)-L-threonylcarbamoyladenosine(37)-C(2))-methylthiotransferase MtaB [bacterium]
MITKNNTIAFYTFGCKVNQYDTQRLRAAFIAAGWKEVKAHEEAQLYVINTCTVTADSDRKARQLIRSIARNHPQAEIIVTGCSAELYPAELKQLPKVSFVLGNREQERIIELISQRNGMYQKPAKTILTSISEFAGHTRAFIKVQDGCNGYCAYCIVPKVRGEPRSRPEQEIIHEVELLAQKGYKEIVLTGIRLGLYGKDNYATPGSNLSTLISKLTAIDGIKRIRLSSLEPMDIELPALLDVFRTEPKLCHHLHIPLQSGSDEILSAMQRTYTVQQYEEMINRIRECIFDIAITTDIIVGFPGETEKHFQQTIEMLCRIGFAKTHVFRYSVRPGTKSSMMGNQIDSQIAKQRVRQLIQLAEEVASEYRKKWIGKTVDVLVEEKLDNKTGFLTGLTNQYLRVNFPGDATLFNQLISVTIEHMRGMILIGRKSH